VPIGAAINGCEAGKRHASLMWMARSRSRSMGQAPTHRPFVTKQSDGSWSVTSEVRDIRPGDTIVVPCEYGGIGEHGTWDPTSLRP